MAAGYMDAMHGLCVKCHEEEKGRLDPPDDDLDSCRRCHRHVPDSDSILKPRSTRRLTEDGAAIADKGADR
jgi:hypothetical protein